MWLWDFSRWISTLGFQQNDKLSSFTVTHGAFPKGGIVIQSKGDDPILMTYIHPVLGGNCTRNWRLLWTKTYFEQMLPLSTTLDCQWGMVEWNSKVLWRMRAIFSMALWSVLERWYTLPALWLLVHDNILLNENDDSIHPNGNKAVGQEVLLIAEYCWSLCPNRWIWLFQT